MKILLVDDHALFREGMALLLKPLVADLEIGEAASCEQAFDVIRNGFTPDLALMDLAMPGMNGIAGIALLHEQCPEMPVVALSSSDDRVTVLQALDAGAMGFIPKSSSSTVMLGALRLILGKGIYLPPSAFLAGRGAVDARPPAARAPSAPSAPPGRSVDELALTPRQKEVLYRILQGKPAKVICRELDLSGPTVKTHTSAVLRALNVTTRTQAVVAAGRMGLRFAESDEDSGSP